MSGFTPRKEVGLVASDPLVLSAGGTTLDASHTTGAWIGETAWGLPDGSPGSAFQASGGGFSHLFPRPPYQNGVQGIGSMRGVPDVAADGDPVTGIAVITSNADGGYTISGHAGTSASAPLWAGTSPSPTSTRSATSASLTLPSTRSPAARSTTGLPRRHRR
jgi:subtilase family serine protease